MPSDRPVVVRKSGFERREARWVAAGIAIFDEF
jgi:hypothetical protein